MRKSYIYIVSTPLRVNHFGSDITAPVTFRLMEYENKNSVRFFNSLFSINTSLSFKLLQLRKK